MTGMPAMRVLGYQETRPHLRLLSLPEERVEPAPVRVDASDCAIDHAILREGWIALVADQVRGIAVPLTGDAFRVGHWYDCVAALDPRTVWLGSPSDVGLGDADHHSPTALAEYDGVQRRIVTRLELPPRSRLEAVAPAGLIFGRRFDDSEALQIQDWNSGATSTLDARGWCIAAHGSTLALRQSDGEVVLLDVADRTRRIVPRPTSGAWDQFASFSPDGRWLAIGIGETRCAAPPSAETEVCWTRLALVAVRSGEVTLAAGRCNNFITSPVWTRDSAWLVFDAPFDHNSFACAVRGERPELVPFARRRGRPVPLVDVTGALAER